MAMKVFVILEADAVLGTRQRKSLMAAARLTTKCKATQTPDLPLPGGARCVAWLRAACACPSRATGFGRDRSQRLHGAGSWGARRLNRKVGRQTSGGIREFTGLQEMEAVDTDTADTACVHDRLTLFQHDFWIFFLVYFAPRNHGSTVTFHQ